MAKKLMLPNDATGWAVTGRLKKRKMREMGLPFQVALNWRMGGRNELIPGKLKTHTLRSSPRASDSKAPGWDSGTCILKK